MDIEKLKEVIKLFEKTSLSKLEITDEKESIKLEKAAQGAKNLEPKDAASIVPETKAVNTTPVVESSSNVIVASPTVGTFYRRSSPSSKCYVELYEKVKKGQVLCIIEAMKVMNEIESPVDGEVVAIHAENDSGVEFGKPLFEIKEIKNV